MKYIEKKQTCQSNRRKVLEKANDIFVGKVAAKFFFNIPKEWDIEFLLYRKLFLNCIRVLRQI